MSDTVFSAKLINDDFGIDVKVIINKDELKIKSDKRVEFKESLDKIKVNKIPFMNLVSVSAGFLGVKSKNLKMKNADAFIKKVKELKQ